MAKSVTGHSTASGAMLQRLDAPALTASTELANRGPLPACELCTGAAAKSPRFYNSLQKLQILRQVQSSSDAARRFRRANTGRIALRMGTARGCARADDNRR